MPERSPHGPQHCLWRVVSERVGREVGAGVVHSVEGPQVGQPAKQESHISLHKRHCECKISKVSFSSCLPCAREGLSQFCSCKVSVYYFRKGLDENVSWVSSFRLNWPVWYALQVFSDEFRRPVSNIKTDVLIFHSFPPLLPVRRIYLCFMANMPENSFRFFSTSPIRKYSRKRNNAVHTLSLFAETIW